MIETEPNAMSVRYSSLVEMDAVVHLVDLGRLSEQQGASPSL